MKQMKEQDLFEDLRDDSVLEYLHDYQENTAYLALLSELNALLRKELARIGVDPAHSLELVVAICRHIGGMQVYVPRGIFWRILSGICVSGVILTAIIFLNWFSVTE